MNNYAIALNSGTPGQRNSITSFFDGKNWAYWHWIDDFWIVQVPDDYTPHKLHSEIEELSGVGKPTMLIFEFHGTISYWGRGKADAWAWLDHIGHTS